jgi:hypothetical protein
VSVSAAVAAQQAAAVVAQQAAAAHAAAAAVSAAVAAGANATASNEKALVPVSQASQPKRLHVSNIPFRFRDPDLRNMFGVRIMLLLQSNTNKHGMNESMLFRQLGESKFILAVLYFSNMAQYLM